MENNLNAKIFRLGNIMPRQSDGKFQQNINQNIFITALKNIYNIKMISKNMLNLNVEFSPVDECAQSIVDLLNSEGNNIYHILNNNVISIQKLINIFEKDSEPFKIVNNSKFVKAIEQTSDEYVKEYILSTNLNKYSENITIKELKKYNFNWSKTDESYIIKILETMKGVIL